MIRKERINLYNNCTQLIFFFLAVSGRYYLSRLGLAWAPTVVASSLQFYLSRATSDAAERLKFERYCAVCSHFVLGLSLFLVTSALPWRKVRAMRLLSVLSTCPSQVCCLSNTVLSMVSLGSSPTRDLILTLRILSRSLTRSIFWKAAFSNTRSLFSSSCLSVHVSQL